MRSVTSSSIRATARSSVSAAGLASPAPRAALDACEQRRGAPIAVVVSRRHRAALRPTSTSTPSSSRATTVVATRAAPDSAPSSSSSDPSDELSGQITAELMESMRLKIAAALETDPSLVRVGDASGDGRHVEIDAVAAAFEGKKSMERQRMVYKAIWQELAETVHAVDAMTTRTPEEAGQK